MIFCTVLTNTTNAGTLHIPVPVTENTAGCTIPSAGHRSLTNRGLSKMLDKTLSTKSFYLIQPKIARRFLKKYQKIAQLCYNVVRY